MPDQEQQEFFNRLEIMLAVSGVPDAAAAFQEICNKEKEALRNVNALKIQYGGLDKAVKTLIGGYKARNKIAIDGLKREQKQVKATTRAIENLRGGLRSTGAEAKAAFKHMVMPASFGSALRLTVDYNKSLLDVSASVNRLGIGLSYLEGTLARVASSVSLTRKETIQLFDEFQTGMRFISLSQFEDILKRTRNIVGANAQAIGKMQGAIAAVSQEYPSLAMGLANLSKVGATLDAAEKISLKNRIRNLYFIGKITDAQYKQLSSYISGNQQIIGSDKTRQREMERNIQAAQEFQRQIEFVGLAVGESILPYLAHVTDFLREIREGTKSWLGTLGKVGLAYAGLKIAGGFIATLGGGMAGSLLGGGGGLAKAAKAGGAGSFGKGRGMLGMVTGAVGAPVRVKVVNLKEMALMQKLSTKGVGRLKAPVPAIAPMGLQGLFKARGLTALKGLGAGGLLAGGSWAAGRGAEALERGGHRQAAGAVGLAGAGLALASGAKIGATIGTFIAPGIGTALGGVAGGIIGAATQWKSVGIGIENLLGKKGKIEAEVKAKIPPDFKEELAKMGTKAAELKNLQVDIKKVRDEDIAAVTGGKAINALYRQVSTELIDANTVLDEQRKKIDKEILSKFKLKYFDIDVDLVGKETSTDAVQRVMEQEQEKINRAKTLLETRRKDLDLPQIRIAETIIKKGQKRVKNLHEIVETIEEGNDEYKRLSRLQAVIAGRMDGITTVVQKQKDVVAAINGLYQAQTSYLSNIIEKMSITGQIDFSVMTGAIEKSLLFLNQEIVAQQDMVALMKISEGLDARKEASNEKRSKQEQGMFQTLVDMKVGLLDQAAIDKVILQAEDRINQKVVERTKILLQAGNIFQDQLKYTEAVAQKSSVLVQLADNYAIGVGASAEMRVRAYKAEGKNIDVLQKQLSVQTAIIRKFKDGSSENIRAKAKVVELETGIANAQMRQAQAVKALRDRWISVISAMNVGAEGFSEIIMNAEQNTAQIMRLEGSVRSAASGAFALRDAFGDIAENVGVGAVKMNQFGQFIASGGRDAWAMAYDTLTASRMGVTKETGGWRQFERAERDVFYDQLEGLSRQAEATMAGHAETLAVGANKYLKGAALESHVTDQFVRQIASEANKTKKEMAPRDVGTTRDIAQSIAAGGATGGFQMGPGFQKIQLPPVKMDSKWLRALREAPKGTASRLIINEKRDAIPVYVVNISDLRNLRDVGIGREIKATVRGEDVTPGPMQPKAVAPSSTFKFHEALTALSASEKTKAEGIIHLEKYVKMDEEIDVAEILSTGNLSKEGEKYFKAIQKIGVEVIDQVRMQELISRTREIMAYDELKAATLKEGMLTTLNERMRVLGTAGADSFKWRSKAVELETEIVAHRKKALFLAQSQLAGQREIQGDISSSQRKEAQFKKNITDEVKQQARFMRVLFQGMAVSMDGIEGAVEEKIVKDPLKIYYQNITKEIIRISKEYNLPPEKVLTYYTGFTKEIMRVAKEQNLPPLEVITRYSGFTREIKRFADEVGLPSKKVPEIFSGFVSEIYRVAELTEQPPKRVEEIIVGYTKVLQRYATDKGLSLEELLINYEGITSGVDAVKREVIEFGLNTDDLFLAYSGETAAKDRITRNIVEVTKMPEEVEVQYDNIINKFRPHLEHVNIPPSKIPVMLRGIKDSFIQYTLYGDEIPKQISGEVQGVKESILQYVSYTTLPSEKIPAFIKRAITSYAQSMEYKDLPPAQIPTYVTDFINNIKQYASYTVIPPEKVNMEVDKFIESYRQEAQYPEKISQEVQFFVRDVMADFTQTAYYPIKPPAKANAWLTNIINSWNQKVVYGEVPPEEIPGYMSGAIDRLKQYVEYDDEQFPHEKVHAEIINIIRDFKQKAEYKPVSDEVQLFVTDLMESITQRAVYPLMPSEKIRTFVKDTLRFYQQRLVYSDLPEENIPSFISGFINDINQLVKYKEIPPEDVSATIKGVIQEYKQESRYKDFPIEVDFFISDVISSMIQHADYQTEISDKITMAVENVKKFTKQEAVYIQDIPEEILTFVRDAKSSFVQHMKYEQLPKYRVPAFIQGAIELYNQHLRYTELPDKIIPASIKEVITQFEQYFSYADIPENKIDVVVRKVIDSFTQYGDYRTLPREVSLFLEGAIDEFTQSIEYKDAIPETMDAILTGAQKSFVQNILYSELPDSQIPGFVKQYLKYLRQSVIYRELPPRSVVGVMHNFETAFDQWAIYQEDVPKEVQAFIRGSKAAFVQRVTYEDFPPEIIKGIIKDSMSALRQVVDYREVPPRNIPASIRNVMEDLTQYATYEDVPKTRFEVILRRLKESFTQYAMYPDLPKEAQIFLDGSIEAFAQRATYLKLPEEEVPGLISDYIKSFVQHIYYDEIPPENIPAYIQEIIKEFRSTVQYQDLPPERVETFVENYVSSFRQEAVYKEAPPIYLHTKIYDAIDSFNQFVKYGILPPEEVAMKLSGWRDQFVSKIVEENIPPEKSALIFTGWRDILKSELEIEENPFDVLVKVFSRVEEATTDVAIRLQQSINAAASNLGIRSDQFVMDYSPIYKIIEDISDSADVSIDSVFDTFRQLNDIILSVGIPDVDAGSIKKVQATLIRQSSAIFESINKQIEALDNVDIQVIFDALPDVVSMLAKSEPEKDVDLDISKFPDEIKAKLLGIPDAEILLTGIAETIKVPVKQGDISGLEVVAYYEVAEQFVKIPTIVEGEVKPSILQFPEQDVYNLFTELNNLITSVYVPKVDPQRIRAIEDTLRKQSAEIFRSIEQQIEGLNDEQVRVIFKALPEVVSMMVESEPTPLVKLDISSFPDGIAADLQDIPRAEIKLTEIARIIRVPVEEGDLSGVEVKAYYDIAEQIIKLPTQIEGDIKPSVLQFPEDDVVALFNRLNTLITSVYVPKVDPAHLAKVQDTFKKHSSAIFESLHEEIDGLKDTDVKVIFEALPTIISMMAKSEDPTKPVELDISNFPDEVRAKLEKIEEPMVKLEGIAKSIQIPARQNFSDLEIEAFYNIAEQVVDMPVVVQGQVDPTVLRFPEEDVMRIFERLNYVIASTYVPKVNLEEVKNIQETIKEQSSIIFKSIKDQIETLDDSDVEVLFRALPHTIAMTAKTPLTDPILLDISSFPGELPVELAEVPPVKTALTDIAETVRIPIVEGEMRGLEVTAYYKLLQEVIKIPAKVEGDIRIPILQFSDDDVYNLFNKLDTAISSIEIRDVDPDSIKKVQATLFKQSTAIFGSIEKQIQGLNNLEIDVLYEALPSVVSMLAESKPEQIVDLDISKLPGTIEGRLEKMPDAVFALTEIAKTIKVPVKDGNLRDIEAEAYYDVAELIVAMPTKVRGEPSAAVLRFPDKIEKVLLKTKVIEKPEEAHVIIKSLEDVYKVTADIRIPDMLPVVARNLGYDSEIEFESDFSPVFNSIKEMSMATGRSVDEIFDAMKSWPNKIDNIFSDFNIDERRIDKIKRASEIKMEDIYISLGKAFSHNIMAINEINPQLNKVVDKVFEKTFDDISSEDRQIIIKSIPEVLELYGDPENIERKVKTVVEDAPEKIGLRAIDVPTVTAILSQVPREVALDLDKQNLRGLEAEAYVKNLVTEFSILADWSKLPTEVVFKLPQVLDSILLNAQLPQEVDVSTILDLTEEAYHVVGDVEGTDRRPSVLITNVDKVFEVELPTPDLTKELNMMATSMNISTTKLLTDFGGLNRKITDISLATSQPFDDVLARAIRFSSSLDDRLKRVGKSWGLDDTQIIKIKEAAVDSAQRISNVLKTKFEGLADITLPNNVSALELIAKNVPEFIELTAKDEFDKKYRYDILLQGMPEEVTMQGVTKRIPRVEFEVEELSDAILVPIDDRELDWKGVKAYVEAIKLLYRKEDVTIGEPPELAVLFNMDKMNVPAEKATAVLGNLQKFYEKIKEVDIEITDTPTIILQNIAKSYVQPDVQTPVGEMTDLLDSLAESMMIVDASDKAKFVNSFDELNTAASNMSLKMGISISDIADLYNKFAGEKAPELNVDFGKIVKDSFADIKLPREKFDDFKEQMVFSASKILSSISGQIQDGLPPDIVTVIIKEMPHLFTAAVDVKNRPERAEIVLKDVEKYLEYEAGTEINTSSIKDIFDSISQAIYEPVGKLGLVETRIDEYKNRVLDLVEKTLLGINAENIGVIGKTAKYILNFSEVDKLINETISELRVDFEEIIDPDKIDKGVLMSSLIKFHQDFETYIRSPQKMLSAIHIPEGVESIDIGLPMDKLARLFPNIEVEINEATRALNLDKQQFVKYFSEFYRSVNDFSEETGVSISNFLESIIGTATSAEEIVEGVGKVPVITLDIGKKNYDRIYNELKSIVDAMEIETKDVRFKDLLVNFGNVYSSTRDIVANTQAFINKAEKTSSFLQELSIDGILSKEEINRIREGIYTSPDFDFDQMNGAIDRLGEFGKTVQEATNNVSDMKNVYDGLKGSGSMSIKEIRVAHGVVAKAQKDLGIAQEDFDDELGNIISRFLSQYKKSASEQKGSVMALASVQLEQEVSKSAGRKFAMGREEEIIAEGGKPGLVASGLSTEYLDKAKEIQAPYERKTREIQDVDKVIETKNREMTHLENILYAPDTGIITLEGKLDLTGKSEAARQKVRDEGAKIAAQIQTLREQADKVALMIREEPREEKEIEKYEGVPPGFTIGAPSLKAIRRKKIKTQREKKTPSYMYLQAFKQYEESGSDEDEGVLVRMERETGVGVGKEWSREVHAKTIKEGEASGDIIKNLSDELIADAAANREQWEKNRRVYDSKIEGLKDQPPFQYAQAAEAGRDDTKRKLETVYSEREGLFAQRSRLQIEQEKIGRTEVATMPAPQTIIVPSEDTARIAVVPPEAPAAPGAVREVEGYVDWEKRREREQEKIVAKRGVGPKVSRRRGARGREAGEGRRTRLDIMMGREYQPRPSRSERRMEHRLSRDDGRRGGGRTIRPTRRMPPRIGEEEEFGRWEQLMPPKMFGLLRSGEAMPGEREAPQEVKVAVGREAPQEVKVAVGREAPQEVKVAVGREAPQEVKVAIEREALQEVKVGADLVGRPGREGVTSEVSARGQQLLIPTESVYGTDPTKPVFSEAEKGLISAPTSANTVTVVLENARFDINISGLNDLSTKVAKGINTALHEAVPGMMSETLGTYSA